MIFVTGGTGLVGRHVVQELVGRGDRVTALVRSDQGAALVRRLGAEPFRGTVERIETWAGLTACRAIIHAAAVIDAPGGWGVYQNPNVEGTRLGASRARELGVRFVHISSIAVYGDGVGDCPAGTVTEAAPLGPRDAGPRYGRSKRLAEDAVRAEMGRGLAAIILRPCVIYGEGDRLFLPSVIRHARRGYMPLVGSGRLPLAMVHARSVAEVAVAALESPAAPGRTYHVTEDDELSGEGFVAAFAEGLGLPIKVVRVSEPVALMAAKAADLFRAMTGGGSPGYRAAVRFLKGGNPYSSAAVRRELGWRASVRHREALPAAIRAIASHR
ncbi:MAG: NAD-dependent epimerase/dehydratase family protein [Gemmatimonadota bacterium]|nr:NAD-dependent epimerase/dehydratase family protein [Gemmatimonadota bacterium]MDH4347529.1 NAD-dependent epimerase/dehydratase family protein [Gemmatimonadota bacterium]MDH5282967.1 NAD-dependent epimerase/dehydratase family protein [Gemmatimonadota bacterium]